MMDPHELNVSDPLKVIRGARILSPNYDLSVQYDIHIEDGRIESILRRTPATEGDLIENSLQAHNHLIASSLCHAHIHLDKCFLLSDPKYADLEIVNGDFAEAMELTSEAKDRFGREDLIRRGKWLIGESIAAGVTHMRAFVEVDHVVQFKCIDAAVELKSLFGNACNVQICIFAQEPLFSGLHCEPNRSLIEQALQRCEPEMVEAIGSTPYVEDGERRMCQNIEWMTWSAYVHKMHLDFHLDYNLNRDQKPLAPFVANQTNRCLQSLIDEHGKTLVLGHCTRLTLNSVEEWKSLRQMCIGLPIYFVGLPTSDLFIQGKPSATTGGGERPRGTLQILEMIQRYGLRGAISVNNVGNAFTPYGSCDPMSIASQGVGIYHAGTNQDAQILYDCVSTKAKEAIGYSSDAFIPGAPADFVLFGMGGTVRGPLSKQRGRKTLQEIVSDPPNDRMTVFRGRLVRT